MQGAGRCAARLRTLTRSDASSLVEFAVSLPLLVVLVVGIFDFGGAFNTKQELNNAAREGARYGASEPTYDLGNATPTSVGAIGALVDSYLTASRINDCGLNSAPLTAVGGLEWQYQTISQNGCIGTFTLTITRGFASTTQYNCGLAATNYGPPGNAITANIPCTHITISYPYQWIFNTVIQLIVPGANYQPGAIQIQTDATAINMD
jgi:Flp pilus assembly protein TadG